MSRSEKKTSIDIVFLWLPNRDRQLANLIAGVAIYHANVTGICGLPVVLDEGLFAFLELWASAYYTRVSIYLR